MTNICPQCGKMHDDWPTIAFITPHPYNTLSEEGKKQYVKELNEDFCVIEYENQTDRFIRAVLFQEVKDYCADLHYGVWVSLSEKSFENYNSNFLSEEQSATYFGYLSSQIPEYDNTMSIKTSVVLSGGRMRPEIIPHRDQMDNDFVKDYYEGITFQEAQKRINNMLDK